MTKRIFRTILVVAIGVFLASVLFFMTVLYDYFSGVQRNQLRMQTDLAAQGVQNEAEAYLEGLPVQDYRITWIGADGNVLYDSMSDAQEMENHFEREEIKMALAEGYGESERYSSTLTERYLYSAKRLADGSVIRLSVTQNSLLVLTLGMLQPMIVVFAVVIILSIVLASRLSKKIVQPLNQLDLDTPANNEEYDELAPLLHRLETQQRQIKRQRNELEQRKNEFEAITRGMAEGIVLLNGQGNILSINHAASTLLEADHSVIGKNMISLSRSLALSELLQKAEAGSYAEKVITFGQGRYRLSASPVRVDDQVSGIVLLFLDVTEKEEAEQMRREFTANVSHELKTPLHIIAGCAELLQNDMVKPEDRTRFSQQIYTESQRMIRLVEDIIKLSHLDEEADTMKCEAVDLFELAQETVDILASKAKKAGVHMELQGEHAIIYGVSQQLSSILDNLCDNAIKYNHEGGRVLVTVKDEADAVILSVQDTGIGIPEEHQKRIFERFYRVDKSHSKEMGGTGLGLSIVKHAARLHHASVELQSAVEKGTCIVVRFPKQNAEQ